MRLATTNRFVRRLGAIRLAQAARRFLLTEGRYSVRIARSPAEVHAALALRHRVFNIELAGRESENGSPGIEFDAYDLFCRHLVVIDRTSGETVGTYRINSIETAKRLSGFYSYSEFSIEDLPSDILFNGLEIGRACIAPEHRNTKVLFLLWKGIASFLQLTGKRYLFGCCSIFTKDTSVGAAVYAKLGAEGHLHRAINARTRQHAPAGPVQTIGDRGSADLPPLFDMYLRIGAKVCSGPAIDREFGTIDFLVVFDIDEIAPRYRKMFLS